MGRHSWVATSSSSSASLELDPGLIGDGEYGIPKQCYCGGAVYLDTSNNGDDLGRRFYTCRNRDQDGYHIRKWWDNCVVDEIERLHCDITSLTTESCNCEKAEEALKDIAVLWTDLCVAEKATRDLKEDVEKDIVKMKEDFEKMEVLVRELNKKHSATEITFVLATFVLFLGLFIIWFY